MAVASISGYFAASTAVIRIFAKQNADKNCAYTYLPEWQIVCMCDFLVAFNFAKILIAVARGNLCMTQVSQFS